MYIQDNCKPLNTPQPSTISSPIHSLFYFIFWITTMFPIISISELWRHSHVLYLLKDFRTRDGRHYWPSKCKPGLHCQQWGKYIIFISSLQAALNSVSWFLGHLLPSVLKSEFLAIIVDLSHHKSLSGAYSSFLNVPSSSILSPMLNLNPNLIVSFYSLLKPMFLLHIKSHILYKWAVVDYSCFFLLADSAKANS